VFKRASISWDILRVALWLSTDLTTLYSRRQNYQWAYYFALHSHSVDSISKSRACSPSQDIPQYIETCDVCVSASSYYSLWWTQRWWWDGWWSGKDSEGTGRFLIDALSQQRRKKITNSLSEGIRCPDLNPKEEFSAKSKLTMPSDWTLLIVYICGTRYRSG
jgi:hypothetical protein